MSGAGTAPWDATAGVPRLDDVGDWTKPATSLCPHQRSWDSAFVALDWLAQDGA
jgi:hypothetical protein